MPPPLRDDRRYDPKKDQRSASQSDRDRILYAPALGRLAGVTQVVSPAEGHIFHNRLTHTLEVAQIARRIAENLNNTQQSLATHWGTIDPDTVESAALVHDLGHPPFGHIGEEELERLVVAAGLKEGYEGNAQSFRIVTKLEQRREEMPGLDLTRATLNAALKYPWQRNTEPGKENTKQARKWGAYQSEKDDFAFARDGHKLAGTQPCLEAQIMDWADDIAYSIHDTADFFRAGLIPLDRLFLNADEVEHVFSDTLDRWRRIAYVLPFNFSDLKKVFQD